MAMPPTPDPRSSPIPLDAPNRTPSRDTRDDERPRRAPGDPGQPDAIDAPADDDTPGEAARLAEAGAVTVGAEEAHMGATEEQIGDLTGPGAGYDEHRKR